MTKILKPVCLMVVLALVLSLGLVFAPQARAAPIILTNAGFETGDLTGWTTSIPSGGSAAAVTSYTSSPGGTSFSAQSGSYFALLKTDGQDSYTTLSQSFSATAGDTIEGWAFFDARDFLPFDDTAQVRIMQGATVVATLFDYSVADVGNYGETAWIYWTHTFASDGTYTLEARIANIGDEILASRMGLDGPGLLATKADTLYTDADGNGVPTYGDTLEYEIVVENNSGLTAEGVVFIDTPDANTSLVVGSVTTTQGTVTIGNTAGATSVEVAVSDITAAGSVTITFRVIIESGTFDGISNYGTVSSTNFASVQTNTVVSSLGAVADFSADPREGVAPLTVEFTDLSEPSGEITDWEWNFGDGETSTAPEPTHNYTKEGSYTVSLTVTTTLGADTETKADYITVHRLVAGFSADPTMGGAPHTVTFRDRSTPKGFVDSWHWNFGDGETSSSRTPTHTYQNEGTYTVTLTVKGGDGGDSQTKRNLIMVEAMAFPARLSVRNLQISEVHAQPRQAVGVTANVVNEGGTWGADTVELMINAQFEQAVGVGVAPGTAQPISFTVYKVEPGEYRVTIGEATGTFYVMGEAAPAESQKGGLLVGGELDTGGMIAMVVIGIIIVGGAIFAILLTRRP